MDRSKIDQARAAGYSDDEIADFLAQQDPRVGTAREAGYSSAEILGHLTASKPPAPPPPAPAQGLVERAAAPLGNLSDEMVAAVTPAPAQPATPKGGSVLDQPFKPPAPFDFKAAGAESMATQRRVQETKDASRVARVGPAPVRRQEATSGLVRNVMGERAADTFLLGAETIATGAKMAADVATLATLGAAEPVSKWLGETIQVIQNDKSPRYQEQRMQLAQLMRSDEAGVVDVLQFLSQNPTYAAELGVPSLPAMLAGAGASRAVGLLNAASTAKRGGSAVEVAGAFRTGAATGAAGSNVGMNAGATFTETDGSLVEKLAAAGIAGAGTVVAGRLFGGGAEQTLATGGAAGARAALATGGREMGQESVEAFSQQVGQGVGENQFDLNEATKQAALEGALGGLTGVGAGVVAGQMQQPSLAPAQPLPSASGYVEPENSLSRQAGLTPIAVPGLAPSPGMVGAAMDPTAPAAGGMPNFGAALNRVDDTLNEPTIEAPPPVGPSKEAIDAAAAAAASSPANDLAPPTDGQKEAGNYVKGKIRFDGFNVSIETPKGAERTSKADAPEPWSVTMPAHYGYIKGTVGSDGDQVDVFIGDAADNGRYWVINQNHAPGSGKTGHDEHKVVTGVNSADEAVSLYKASFANNFGDNVYASVSTEFDAAGIKAALPAMQKPEPVVLGNVVETADANATATGAGLVGQPAEAAADDGRVGQGGDLVQRGSLPDGSGLDSGTAALGSAAPAVDEATVAADLKSIQAARMKRGEPVRLSRADVSGDPQLTAIAGAIKAPIVFIKDDSGTGQFAGVAMQGRIYVNVSADEAPLAVVMHEGVHTMPEDIKQTLIKKVMATVSPEQRAKFLDKYASYQSRPEAKQDEELVAMLAQEESKKPQFWMDLADRMGDNDFGRLAKHVIATLDRLLSKVAVRGDDRFTSDIKAVRKALVEAYAQTAERAGVDSVDDMGGVEVSEMSESPEEFGKKLRDGVQARLETGRALAKAHDWKYSVNDVLLSSKTGRTYTIIDRSFTSQGEKIRRGETTRMVATYAVRDSDGNTNFFREDKLLADDNIKNISQPFQGDFSETGEKRQYKLELDREARVESKSAGLTKEERDAIQADGVKLGLTKAQIDSMLSQARDDRKRFPPRAGWAPIKALGIAAERDEETKEVKLDKKGNPKISVNWEKISYGFNKAPGVVKAPPKRNEEWTRKVADQFTRLVKDIYARAEAGDKNAQIIVGHQTWYRNVAEILRREFGGQGDLFADLLGATSPNTPVDTNWRFAIEILQRFSRGEFDAEMKDFEAHIEAGGRPSDFKGEKIRQASGKLYGMNSKNSMVALANLWRDIEAGTAPKARNFALNLIGQSNMATIDVWAARMLRRAADRVRGANLPRIPTVAEEGVGGNWNASATEVTGEFGFGAAVLDLVSEDLKKIGIDLSPPDLQALAWFAEKELWTANNWTSQQGEGGSFEENIEANPTSRYIGGFSVQRGEGSPEEETVSLAQTRLLSVMRGDDTVIAARVLPTYGMFMGKPEEAFDVEWTAKRGEHTPDLVMAEMAKLGQENEQMAVFVSRVMQPDEVSENARPGAEVYFKSGTGMDGVEKAMAAFTSRGLDGFTLAVDPRAKVGSRPGKKFIGVRIQYVPEFDGAATPENIEQLLVQRRQELNDAVAELSTTPGVAFAQTYQYDTEVISGDTYGEFIDRAAAGRDSQAGGQARRGQSVRERLEGAAARIESDAGPDRAGGVPRAGGADAEPQFSEAPARAEAGGLQEPGGLRGGARVLAEPRREAAGARRGTTLEGLPRLIPVDGRGVVEFGGFAPAQEAARAYMRQAGLPYNPPTKYAKIDPARGARIAREFTLMKHDPSDPLVRRAYAAMIAETKAQYESIIGTTGLTVEFIDYARTGDPYGNPRNAILDVVENNHLWVFSTRDGFGSSDLDVSNNPLLSDTGIVISGQPALANDLFRVVHDYFGHIKEGVGFRAEGEENAWRMHSAMYSPLARRAMTSETRGQNSWVNFGPNAEANKTADPGATVYADQKVGLLPEWVSQEGLDFSDEPRRIEPARNPDGGALSRLAAQGYRTSPVPVVPATRNLQTLVRKLDDGRITPAEFELKVKLLAARMAEVVETKQANYIASERVRGADFIREKLIRARRTGDLDQDAVGFALWALDQNPALADSLGIGIRAPAAGQDDTAGYYNPASAVITLLKGSENTDTAVHELLHHTERMMPADMQEAIRNEWAKSLAAAMQKATPERRMALAEMVAVFTGNAGNETRKRVIDLMARDQSLTFKDYQLANPSEFWAVNATRLMRQRYEDRGSVWRRIGTWLLEAGEKLRELLGLRSDAPVLRALDAVLAGDGSQQSERMIFGGRRGRLDDISRKAPLLAPNGKPSKLSAVQHAMVRTPAFKAWFGDWERHANSANPDGDLWSDDGVSKAVDPETREPMVLYHGTDKGGFAAFAAPGGRQRGDLGIFMTDNKSMAKSYVKRGRARDITREDVEAVDADAGDFVSGVYGVFANVRRPAEDDFQGANWDGDFYGSKFEVYDSSGDVAYDADGNEFMERDAAEALADEIGGTFEEASGLMRSTDDVVKDARRSGNDGAIIYRVMDDGGGGAYNYEPSRVVVAFDPNQVKSADFNSGEFGSTDDIRFSDSPTWYSALSRAIDKGPGQAMPDQWRMFIKGLPSKGVKPDEVEWSGVNEWLQLQTGKVSRDAVKAYLDANGVKVEETVLGDGGLTPAEVQEVQELRDLYRRSEQGEDGVFDAGDFDRLQFLEERKGGDSLTKYGSYTLPGGANYREVLLTLPERQATAEVPDLVARGWTVEVVRSSEWTGQKEVVFRDGAGGWRGSRSGAPFAATDAELLADWATTMAKGELREEFRKTNYRSNHWDQTNVLAHIRLNDRVDADGKRVLFVEEIQSDWGQDGKKRGFNSGALRVVESNKALPGGGNWWHIVDAGGRVVSEQGSEAAANAKLREMSRSVSGSVPAAPFVTATDKWLGLALKRVVKMAVDGGYDRVAFVTGEQSAERYDLSKQVNYVQWNPGYDGVRKLVQLETVNDEIIGFTVLADGKVDDSTRGWDGKDLDEVVGKELAQKIMAADNGDLRGLDLKVGGEGMKAFYDVIVPAAVKTLLKKVGGKGLTTSPIPVEMVGVAAAGGSAMVEPMQVGAGRWVLVDRSGDRVNMVTYGSKEEAMEDAELNESSVDVMNQPAFDITMPMRAAAADGMPMFSEYEKEKDRFGRKFIGSDSKPRTITGSDLKTGTVKSDKMVDFLSRAIDEEYPIINAARQTADAVGDAWVRAVEALPGRTADRMAREKEAVVDPLVAAIGAKAKALKIKPAQLVDAYGVYALALHAPERNASLRANGSKKANPSGMSEGEAADWMRFFRSEPDLLAALQSFTPLLKRLQARTDQVKMGAGLLTQDELDARNQWKHYVGLQGDPAMADVGGSRMGGSWNNDQDPKAKGRDSLSANPIVNTVRQLEAAVKLAEMAKVKKATYDFAVAHPDVIQAKVKRLVRRPVYDDKGNFATTVPSADKFAQDAIVYRNGDVEYHIEIGDQRVLEAIKRVGVVDNDWVTNSVGRLTRGLGRLWTQFSPHFPLINFIRDLQQQVAIIAGSELTGANGKPISSMKAAWTIMSSYHRTLPAAVSEVMGLAPRGKYTRAARELVAAGGTSGLVRMLNDEKSLEDFVREVAWKAGKQKASLGWNKFVDVVTNISEVFELTTRVAAFEALRDLGMNTPEAANVTKNVMNFSKAGKDTRKLANFYMFLRPSVTDVYKTSQLLRTKKGGLLVVGMYAGAVALYSMLRAMSGDDEEDERLKNMDTRQANERRGFIILPFGGEEPVRIPVGFGLPRLAWGLATVTVDSYANPDFDAADAADGVIKSLSSSLSPMQMSDINMFKDTGAWAATSFAPTLAVPLLELAMNKSKAGNTVTKAGGPFQSLPDYALGFSSTPKEWKDAARAMYEMTGGGVDVSPETMQYLVRAYGGGPAGVILNGLRSREKLRQGEELTRRDVPIVQAFTGPEDRYPERGFRELAMKLSEIKRQIKDSEERGDDFGESLLQDADKALVYSMKEDIESIQRDESAALTEIRKLQLVDYEAGARQLKEIERDVRRAKQELMNAYNDERVKQ